MEKNCKRPVEEFGENSKYELQNNPGPDKLLHKENLDERRKKQRPGRIGCCTCGFGGRRAIRAQDLEARAGLVLWGVSAWPAALTTTLCITVRDMGIHFVCGRAARTPPRG